MTLFPIIGIAKIAAAFLEFSELDIEMYGQRLGQLALQFDTYTA